MEKLSEAQFHTVWTSAVGKDGYSKKLFQNVLTELQQNELILPVKEAYEGKADNTSEKDLRVCEVMPPLFNFKSKRKEIGMTLRQVEDKTGISNAYLSQLETGKIKNPSYRVVEVLYRLYNGA